MFQANGKASNRILVLSNALSGGGAESVAHLMVKHLEGASCVVFENDAGVLVPGSQIWVSSKVHKGGLVATLLLNCWRLVVIQWVKIRLRPTLTISHLEGPNFANMLTILGGKKTLFVHNRFQDSYSGGSFSERLKITLAKFLYSKAGKIVGVSSSICRELTESFKVEQDKVIYIPNPIDRSAIVEASTKRYGDYRDQLLEYDYLISVASLTPQKNHEFLLKIYKQLLKDCSALSKYKLILLGEGELNSALQQLCQDLDLSFFSSDGAQFSGRENVYFLGFQPNPYRLISQAKLLVMPSRWEGLPIALLEAMSLGVPAVVSDCSDGIRSAWRIQDEKLDSKRDASSIWTSFGVLIKDMNDDSCTAKIWVKTVTNLLEDDRILQNCVAACLKRSDDYNIDRVVKHWKHELLSP